MNRKVILLVEDNPDDEALTLRALKKNRLSNEVIVARDGEEAINYLFALSSFVGRDITDWPAVVLLDIQLPKVGGLDVLKRIRSDERTRRMPVVILTSSKEERDLIQSYDLGVNSYVRKPVNFDEFVKAVSQIGLYWLILNEMPASRPNGSQVQSPVS